MKQHGANHRCAALSLAVDATCTAAAAVLETRQTLRSGSEMDPNQGPGELCLTLLPGMWAAVLRTYSVPNAATIPSTQCVDGVQGLVGCRLCILVPTRWGRPAAWWHWQRHGDDSSQGLTGCCC